MCSHMRFFPLTIKLKKIIGDSLLKCLLRKFMYNLSREMSLNPLKMKKFHDGNHTSG